MILFIDNYDSFTYNLVQYLRELLQTVAVYKNDEISLEEVAQLNPSAIILGPGPCKPEQAGITLALIAEFAGKIPILGICLGHQAIGQAFAGEVVQAKEVMHGRISAIYHTGKGVFSDIPSPFMATRYHSLVLQQETLPACLEITAWTALGDRINKVDEIMGIRHRELAIEGVQFHPESILSEAGYQLLNNFLRTHGLAVLSNEQLPELE